MERTDEVDVIDRKVSQLFALVSEALAQATHALLNGDLDMGRRVVAGDQIVDDLTAEVEMLVWRQIDRPGRGPELRQLIGQILASAVRVRIFGNVVVLFASHVRFLKSLLQPSSLPTTFAV